MDADGSNFAILTITETASIYSAWFPVNLATLVAVQILEVDQSEGDALALGGTAALLDELNGARCEAAEAFCRSVRPAHDHVQYFDDVAQPHM